MKVIGLMSGTSIDGIDAALVEIKGQNLAVKAQLLNAKTYPYPDTLKQEIIKVSHGQPLSIAEFTALDDEIAYHFAIAAKDIQSQTKEAALIGSHGQTVYHRPPILSNQKSSLKKPTNSDPNPSPSLARTDLGYSVQLGRGAIIADLMGIPTVSNFRAADIAAGGQGAPLVPKVDASLLTHPTKHRAVQNLGGMGNVTYLPPRNQVNWLQEVRGWDTGPGNILIDLAITQVTQGKQNYDFNGDYAARGKPCHELVSKWLKQNYFEQNPPKSTGRELFNQEYLVRCRLDADEYQLNSYDWLATITELTVASIVHSYQTFLKQVPEEVLLCGGGSHNLYLRQRLQAELKSSRVVTTAQEGVDSDYKEAIAFAILAYWRFHNDFPSNLPQVTSAREPLSLGDIAFPYRN